jgi:hypothetical protein
MLDSKMRKFQLKMRERSGGPSIGCKDEQAVKARKTVKAISHITGRLDLSFFFSSKELKQRQFFDGKNMIAVLPPPFSPHAASEIQIANVKASFAGRPRNSGTIPAVINAASEASTPKRTYSELDDDDGKQRGNSILCYPLSPGGFAYAIVQLYPTNNIHVDRVPTQICMLTSSL